MGLFDKIKEAAGVDNLVQGAKDKVSDATGIDVDSTLEAADKFVEAGENISDAAEAFKSKSE
jgi:hypothetical protein